MILFRLADLPRSTWRLPRAVPALPDAPRDGTEATLISRGLRPALLDAEDGATLERVAGVIAAYAEAVGRSRGELRTHERTLEERVGDYRLARCLARCVEDWYSFAPPVATLLPPAAARALLYRRASERHAGYVPTALRDAFLAEVAAEVGCTPGDLENAVQADLPARAILTPRSGTAPAPREVAQAYNTAAVATMLAAAAFVTLLLPPDDVAALKLLYRSARGLRVGVDLSLVNDGRYVQAVLYGPGSRALVRLREVSDTDPDEVEDELAAPTVLPAAGGPALALAVSTMARRSSTITGYAHLLGPDRRAYHYPLDKRGMTALAGHQDRPTDEADAPAYDSMVEADFASVFLAQQAGGRMGLARGWMMVREPRPVIAGATVFLPDFGFRRSDVEVLCEVVGYYTDDYLARKRRKLADLRGRIVLLLIVDEALAPHISPSGFPTITYRSGRVISISAVVAALEREFDPFSRRRGGGAQILHALCAAPGPPLDEEALCAATGAAGRAELQALWDDVAAASPAVSGRRYVPGQGLVPFNSTAAAATLLAEHLAAAGGCLPLEDAFDLCRSANLLAPDDALLAHLGVEVRRQGLFGAAHACLPGAPDVTQPTPDPPRPRRRR